MSRAVRGPQTGTAARCPRRCSPQDTAGRAASHPGQFHLGRSHLGRSHPGRSHPVDPTRSISAHQFQPGQFHIRPVPLTPLTPAPGRPRAHSRELPLPATLADSTPGPLRPPFPGLHLPAARAAIRPFISGSGAASLAWRRRRRRPESGERGLLGPAAEGAGPGASPGGRLHVEHVESAGAGGQGVSTAGRARGAGGGSAVAPQPGPRSPRPPQYGCGPSPAEVAASHPRRARLTPAPLSLPAPFPVPR